MKTITITWGVFSLGAKLCEVPDDFDIENATSDELADIVGDDALNPDYLGPESPDDFEVEDEDFSI